MTEKSLQEQHIPVMCNRVLELFSPCLNSQNAILLDATLGLAGHSLSLLEKFPNLKVIAFDRDEIALERAKLRLEKYLDRVIFINQTFDQIEKSLNGQKVNAILFDLGVSSIQLDESNRGFSYAKSAPLDMRMDSKQKLDAQTILNNYEVEELTKILREYGEEKFAFKIAKAIVKRRTEKKFDDTLDLATLIKNTIPAPARRTGGNPAKRTFQALRIAVNNELEILENAIPQALSALVVGGRLVILSYQSLEDRIVKNAFRKETANMEFIPGLPILTNNEKKQFELINKKAEQASQVEISNNPRASSVRLRAIKRIGEAA